MMLSNGDVLCAGRSIVANRPAAETDLSAEFTYVDGYDTPSDISQPVGSRAASQSKVFSLFRSKKSAQPTNVQPMQTTITAGSYSGPRGSSLRRRENAPYQPSYQQNVGLPQLIVTAPSRLDTADSSAEQVLDQPAWQTINAFDHPQAVQVSDST